MAAARSHRITVGFKSGQSMPARVTARTLAALNKALDRGPEGWHELECDDGTVRLDLAQIVFVRVESDDPRVGFGA